MSTAPSTRGPRLSLGAVAVLGGVAATFAFLVGAVSLTRIAGDYLGFPDGLDWTFTGSTDVAGIAGGIMWAAFAGDVRSIGRAMNLVCTVVSGVGVGLDHATHSGKAARAVGDPTALPVPPEVWPFVAFIAGVFVPALATWILHALSHIADGARAGGRTVGDEVADRQATAGDRQATASPDRQANRQVRAGGSARTASPRPPASPARNRQAPGDIASPTASSTASPSPALPAGDRQDVLTMTTGGPDGALTISGAPEVAPASRSPRPPAESTQKPTRPIARQEWMTDLLIHQVVKRVAAATPSKPYGRPQVARDFKLTGHKARTLLDYIAERDLAREAAS